MTVPRSVPLLLPNEFNKGLDQRKAIYVPYPQAVPNAFLVTKRGTSPCKNTCPAETSAQGYMALIQAGRYQEALQVIKEYNPFPATVGRVCNHPCEDHCNRGKLDSPVAICALKRFVADWVYEHRDELPKKEGENRSLEMKRRGPNAKGRHRRFRSGRPQLRSPPRSNGISDDHLRSPSCGRRE